MPDVRSFVGALILSTPLLLAPSASAGPKPIKAYLQCSSEMPDGTQKQLTGAGKTGRLGAPVGCVMHMNDPKEAHMGTIKTIRHTVDPATGKRVDVPGTSFTTDFGAGSERPDLVVELKNGEPMADQSLALKPCEDFDIVATISDDLGVYFTKTVKVVQGCPKPTPLKGTVSCDFEPTEGKIVKMAPSAKRKERPYPLKDVSCVITTKDTRILAADSVQAIASWTEYTDAGPSPRSEAVGAQVHGDKTFVAGFDIPTTSFPNCQEVDLTFAITVGGDRVFTQKIPTAITCGE